jgi:hypothetical protein
LLAPKKRFSAEARSSPSMKAFAYASGIAPALGSSTRREAIIGAQWSARPMSATT